MPGRMGPELPAQAIYAEWMLWTVSQKMDNTAHRVLSSVTRGTGRTQAGFRTHLLRREGCTFALSVRAAV